VESIEGKCLITYLVSLELNRKA